MTDFHAFACGGANFLFFPRSARLYALSEAAAGMLAELSCRPSSLEIFSALQTLPGEDLPDRTVLHDELREVFRQELQVPHPPPPSSSRIQEENSFQCFSVYLAQTCNMSCGYCWNRGGSFGKPPRLLGINDAGLVTDLIVSLVESSTADRVSIKFYGGEPLLNFAALERITLELRQQEARLAKNFLFSVDTNGLLLEGKSAQFLARHFSQVGVSLDGREAIHDRQRPGTCGERTWQRIVDNLMAFPNPKLLCLRATLTAHSDPYLETFRHLAALGIQRIQLEYCHETGYREDPLYRKLAVPRQRQLGELRRFLDDYIDTISRFRDSRDIPFVSNLLDNIAKIGRGDRFARACGTGKNTLAINSRGELFPCIAFADRNEFSMGRVGSRGTLPPQQTLAAFQVDDRPSCRSCWLRYDCAGGCYATHYNMTGHPQQPHPEYCSSMRGKAEIYLYAMAQMQKKCPWHLEYLKRNLRGGAE